MTVRQRSVSLPCRLGWHKYRPFFYGLHLYTRCIDCGKVRG